MRTATRVTPPAHDRLMRQIPSSRAHPSAARAVPLPLPSVQGMSAMLEAALATSWTARAMPHKGTCVRHHWPEATPMPYPTHPTTVQAHCAPTVAFSQGRRARSAMPRENRSRLACQARRPRSSGGGGRTVVTSGPRGAGFQPRIIAATRLAAGTTAAPTMMATR